MEVLCMNSKEMMKKILLREYKMLESYGTNYRFVTARISLEVLENVYTPEVFSDRENTLKLVNEKLKNKDSDRIKDVAKMLNVTFKQMQTRQNQSKNFKKKLSERTSSSEKVSLELVK